MISLWYVYINTMFQLVLFVIPGTAVNIHTNTDKNEALRLSTQVPESNPETTVANLTELLSNNGIHIDLPQPNISHPPFTFELLDIGANLLSMLYPHQRVNFASIVHIDTHFGLVKFSVPLDRERLCQELQGTSLPCMVNLLLVAHLLPASDKPRSTEGTVEIPQQTIYIDLTITIKDLNDNIPYFPKLGGSDLGLRTLHITEECPIGTLISLPIAVDADSIENGVQRYAFHSTSTSVEVKQHFQIRMFHGLGVQCEHINLNSEQSITATHSSLKAPNSEQSVTPCLQVIHRVDREQTKQFNFRLVAFDAANQQGEINIRIIVRDINDNYPIWSRLLTAYTPDGRTRLLEGVQSSGWDDPFAPNRTTNIYRYAITTRECTTQRKLIQLKADDQDDSETDNGKVSFQFSEQSPELERMRRRVFISGNHIYLTDSGLRGLSLMNISLLVTASDGAGKSSDAWMDLYIEDCNDHPPMILMRGTEFSLIENNIGQADLISLITVRDLDVEASPNSVFRCFLNDTRYFLLKEVVRGPEDKRSGMNLDQTGIVEIDSNHDLAATNFASTRRGRWSVFRLESQPSVSFDRETTPKFTVLIQCIDNGTPALTSTRAIVINIQDINDNKPIFYQKEDRTPFGENHPLSWNMQPPGGSKTNLAVKEQTLFEFRIPENAERGSFVGRLYAMDRDSGENGRITFELLSSKTYGEEKPKDGSSRDEMFTVSTTGEIHLIKDLDREQCDKYELHIQAKDGGRPEPLSNTATVVINVEDVNDCHPQFHGEYNFHVVESYGSSTIHQVLGTLNATDADLGRNGSVSFRIAKGQVHERGKYSEEYMAQGRPGSQLLQVSHDGQLTIYGVVDREKTPVILVDVIAEDNGFPVHLSSTITVTIHVLDLNDNKPKFAFEETANLDQSTNRTKPDLFGPAVTGEPTHMLNLSLDTNIGTTLMKFKAIDPDDGPNGTITYEIIYSGIPSPRTSTKVEEKEIKSKNSEAPQFILHPDGRLILSRRLEFDELPSSSNSKLTRLRYRRPDRLLIRASDNGPVPEHAITGLHVFYFDPLAGTSDKTLGGNMRSYDQKQSIRTFGQMTFKTEDSTRFNDGIFKGKHHREENYANAAATSKSAELSSSRFGSLPVLYLLALAVCFALLLVVASLAYLYVKMKRPPTTRTQKYLDPTLRVAEQQHSLTSSHHNPLGEIQLEVSTCAQSSPDPNDTNSTIRFHGGKTSPMSATGNSSGNYRTLSPTYLLLDRDEPDTLPSREKFARTFWTTTSPDYTVLSANSIGLNYGPNTATMSPEFIANRCHKIDNSVFPSISRPSTQLQLRPDQKPSNHFMNGFRQFPMQSQMHTLSTSPSSHKDLGASSAIDARNGTEEIGSTLAFKTNGMKTHVHENSSDLNPGTGNHIDARTNSTQNNLSLERELTNIGQSKVTASFV